MTGVGRISAPLGVIHMGQDVRLLVSPWAAVGTDALLITTGVVTWTVARPLVLKLVGALGTVWGALALTAELVKLIGGPEGKIDPSGIEIQRQ